MEVVTVTTHPTEKSEALEAARGRRLTLKQAVSAVETAAAAPAAEPRWHEMNVRDLERLRTAFDDHVAEVEAESGLLPELTRTAPRLHRSILQVQHEHPVICAQIDAAIALAVNAAPAAEVRSAALDTLVDIARHRQRGADLVYEGYMVDIGGDSG